MTADYPDFQVPGQIATLIGALGLATQSLQATAAQISAAIAAEGVPSILPVHIRDDGPFNPGAPWSLNGGAAVPFTIGGAYEVLLRCPVFGQVFVTDVTVLHLDANGATCFSETFTVSNWAAGTGQLGVIVRGNMHGTKLIIGGTMFAQADINAVFGAGLTAGQLNVSTYSVPYAGETRPKIVPFSTGNVLLTSQSLAVAASATVTAGVLASYCGDTLFNLRSQTGGGFNVVTRLELFTVAGGSASPLFDLWLPQTGGGNVMDWQDVALPPLLCRMRVTNLSTTTAGAADITMIGRQYI